MRSELLILLVGCAARAPSTDAEDSATPRATPAITNLEWSCDPSAATWSFALDASAWTGGGNLWMAKDPDRVERHRVPSVSAEGDGSADRLSLTLSTVADWRYQTSGASTVWRCAEEAALSFQIAIYTSDGDDRADCRTWGADPMLWDRVDDVTDCANVLEVADDTADTGG